jgi:excisionase family DNA binding protein
LAAIFDRRNGRRYGQAQFISEVVDCIRSEEGRQPCYELLEGLQVRRAGKQALVASITLGSQPGVPEYMQGATYDLVDGESDAEAFDRKWREAAVQKSETEYLKPAEAADLLRVDARTVKRWLQQEKLAGFRTPGGRWRVRAIPCSRCRPEVRPAGPALGV